MTNNHSIAENPESNNTADNLVDFVNSRLFVDLILDGYEIEEEDDELTDMDYKGDKDDDWEELMDEDEDWVELTDEDEDWNECEEDDESAGRYDDWDDECDVTRNPYYNDDLDMDQQSPEFWNSIF